ncbi:Zinc finger protein 75D, partial [Nibea albiflora]
MESVRMCESVQMLRCFVSQRLSAAAAEINVQQLVVMKEEDDPVCQDQGDPLELPHIKEEQEEVWTSREQLQGLDQADIIKFTFCPVAVKSEDEDEEKPQCSQLQEIQTEDMKPEADGEDCGRPEPDRDSDPDHHDETSHFSEPETKAGDDWKKSSGPQSGNRGCDQGDKPFSCSECGKRFSQNSNMKTHMRIHTGEKPFSCSVCGKRFTQKINLTHHIMATHTGERRYSCSVCGRKFTRRYGLKTHQCFGRQSSQLHQRRTEDEEHLKTFREPDKNSNHG